MSTTMADLRLVPPGDINNLAPAVRWPIACPNDEQFKGSTPSGLWDNIAVKGVRQPIDVYHTDQGLVRFHGYTRLRIAQTISSDATAPEEVRARAATVPVREVDPPVDDVERFVRQLATIAGTTCPHVSLLVGIGAQKLLLTAHLSVSELADRLSQPADELQALIAACDKATLHRDVLQAMLVNFPRTAFFDQASWQAVARLFQRLPLDDQPSLWQQACAEGWDFARLESQLAPAEATEHPPITAAPRPANAMPRLPVQSEVPSDPPESHVQPAEPESPLSDAADSVLPGPPPDQPAQGQDEPNASDQAPQPLAAGLRTPLPGEPLPPITPPSQPADAPALISTPPPPEDGDAEVESQVILSGPATDVSDGEPPATNAGATSAADPGAPPPISDTARPPLDSAGSQLGESELDPPAAALPPDAETAPNDLLSTERERDAPVSVVSLLTEVIAGEPAVANAGSASPEGPPDHSSSATSAYAPTPQPNRLPGLDGPAIPAPNSQPSDSERALQRRKHLPSPDGPAQQPLAMPPGQTPLFWDPFADDELLVQLAREHYDPANAPWSCREPGLRYPPWSIDPRAWYIAVCEERSQTPATVSASGSSWDDIPTEMLRRTWDSEVTSLSSAVRHGGRFEAAYGLTVAFWLWSELHAYEILDIWSPPGVNQLVEYEPTSAAIWRQQPVSTWDTWHHEARALLERIDAAVKELFGDVSRKDIHRRWARSQLWPPAVNDNPNQVVGRLRAAARALSNEANAHRPPQTAEVIEEQPRARSREDIERWAQAQQEALAGALADTESIHTADPDEEVEVLDGQAPESEAAITEPERDGAATEVATDESAPAAHDEETAEPAPAWPGGDQSEPARIDSTEPIPLRPYQDDNSVMPVTAGPPPDRPPDGRDLCDPGRDPAAESRLRDRQAASHDPPDDVDVFSMVERVWGPLKDTRQPPRPANPKSRLLRFGK